MIYKKIYKNKSKIKSSNSSLGENQIWKRIIDIKSQLLELQSPCLKVKNQIVSKNYVDIEIEDKDELDFYNKLKQIFQSTINFGSPHSYFYSESNITSKISEEVISELEEEAKKHYLEFKGVPVIEGTITNQGFVNYLQRITDENLGTINKNNHLVDLRKLKQCTSILEEYNQGINRISFHSNGGKLLNSSIKEIRKIKREFSKVIYSAKISTTGIHFDVATYSLTKVLPILHSVTEKIKTDETLEIKLELKRSFDYKAVKKQLSTHKIKSHWSKDSSSLIFWREYKKGNKQIERRILDSFFHDNIISNDLRLNFENTDKEKYLLIVDEEKKRIKNNQSFSNLLGTEYCFRDDITNKLIEFGTLIKFDYPTVRFRLNDTFKGSKKHLPFSEIEPSLKGEKDKIKRLKQTLDNFNPSKNRLLYSIANPEIENNDYSDDDLQLRIEEIKSNCLNHRLNNKQVEAIAKSSLTNSLFLIQGPPGTGKSTAISEIIWQHIIRADSSHYRILVTSETNLAVDNAINKLTSDNMLLKPIRFGNSDSVDIEGQRFLFDNLKMWKTGESDIDLDYNILDKWIDQIVNRAENLADTQIIPWINFIKNKGETVRRIFYESYLEFCNVIGATSASIGEKSSTFKDTPFFKSYKEVTNAKEISFDLVVQDESSKSTPPELILPCIYTKKAIVIGDHRQLPPLINTNEFIEEFYEILDHVKEKYRNEILGSIDFIRKHRSKFEISMFEELFKSLSFKSKSSFNEQYRMHPSINNTISQFYEEDEGLFCGLNPNLVDSKDLSEPSSRYLGQELFNGAKVVWIDTKSPEYKIETSRTNPHEVEVITHLLNVLSQDKGMKEFNDHFSETEEKEIGVITFYGAQRQLIQKSIPKDLNCKVSVVDRFQGMERNVVICSLVRSDKIAATEHLTDDILTDNTGEFSLGFAQSPNRLNVALSRAKRLLIIVGNASHFSQKEIYKKVYNSIQNDPYGLVLDSKELVKSEQN